VLKDQLEIARAMMTSDHATYQGKHHSVNDAINKPAPVQQPWVPIMVGGNGPNVTWRLAARHADELNVDGLTPDEVVEAMPVIRGRCEEIDRDPDTLTVSVHVWSETMATTGAPRVDLLAAYREAGVSRVMGLVRESVRSDVALGSLVEDARAAGVEFD